MSPLKKFLPVIHTHPRLVRDPVSLQQNPIQWWDDCNRSGDCDQDTEAVQGHRVQWQTCGTKFNDNPLWSVNRQKLRKIESVK